MIFDLLQKRGFLPILGFKQIKNNLRSHQEAVLPHNWDTVLDQKEGVVPTGLSHITAFSFIHSGNLIRLAYYVGIWMTPT
jgi:hypothetical protein